LFSRAMNCHSVWRSSTSTPGGRLVEHDHRRPVHQRLRDQHAPLHAARELAHVGVGLVGQAQVVEQLVDPVVVVGHAEVAALDAQRLAHREERVEHQLLRHDAQAAARGGVVGDDVVAEHPHAPAGWRRARPARMLISVVLPAPFGPSSPKNSPGWMSNATCSSACTCPRAPW
jgi:hypothetical protein